LIFRIAETGVNHSKTWVYDYDGLKRLTSANRYAGYFPGTTVPTGSPLSSYTYTYDRNGNRASKTVGGVTTTYQYNTLDQLVSEKRGSLTTKSYTWDNGGRLTGEADHEIAQLSRAYTWTADDRLVAVKCGGRPFLDT
jgi:YD repeat-containing protein